jgi:hypothetical protein
MRLWDRYVEMSKSRVGSKGFDDCVGSGKEIIAIRSRSGGDTWELGRDMDGVRSGLTNATSLDSISESMSSAREYFKTKPDRSKENELTAHHI